MTTFITIHKKHLIWYSKTKKNFYIYFYPILSYTSNLILFFPPLIQICNRWNFLTLSLYTQTTTREFVYDRYEYLKNLTNRLKYALETKMYYKFFVHQIEGWIASPMLGPCQAGALFGSWSARPVFGPCLGNEFVCKIQNQTV